jgi:3-oxoacid CoA-transferase subunit A
VNKVFPSADAALDDLTDGASIMVGGFGLCGVPETLIEAVRRKGTKNLTVISNNCGAAGRGLARLLEAGQLTRVVASYPGQNKALEKLVEEGKVELQLMPQGTFIERIRAGGAGIAAFYTPTGVGTVAAEGREAREFDGRTYLLEHALRADFTFVKAWKGDRWGNLVYRKTARNFNPVMATAARVTIAEVEEVVELGALDPDSVVTPGIYVKRVFQGERREKFVEERTARKR